MATAPVDSLKAASAALSKADPKLRRLIAKVGPCLMVPPRSFNPFEALCSSIGHQQLHGKAAETILGRFRDQIGGGTWPTPDAVAKASMPALRACGLSANKALAMKDLAAKVLDDTVPTTRQMRKLTDDEIVDRIVQVRGIGRWTVEMLLMFRLGRLDVMPVDDFGVRKGFSLLYGYDEMVKPKVLLALSEKWRPYRSVASWYFWRVLDV